MRATLIEYFGDKRDLSSLDQKVGHLTQGNKTLEEYYHESTNLLSDISAKINLDPTNAGHTEHIMRYVRNQIKNAFIDGLNEPYSSFARTCRPDTMVEAYHFVREQVSSDERKRGRTNNPQRITPRIKLPMRNFTPPNYNTGYRTPFAYPQNFQRSFTARPFSQTTPNIPPRDPRPTPMDVDRSIRTRQVNYMNRGNNGAFHKAPFNNFSPNRFNRNFNTHLMNNQNHLDHQEDGNETPNNEQTMEMIYDPYFDSNIYEAPNAICPIHGQINLTEENYNPLDLYPQIEQPTLEHTNDIDNTHETEIHPNLPAGDDINFRIAQGQDFHS